MGNLKEINSVSYIAKQKAKAVADLALRTRICEIPGLSTKETYTAHT